MWSEPDRNFAEWITENTDSTSVFLTSNHLTHPVVTLAGRQIVLGYGGWLRSHGLNEIKIGQIRTDVFYMFEGDYSLIEKYGVSYISVTDYERDFSERYHFKINRVFYEL